MALKITFVLRFLNKMHYKNKTCVRVNCDSTKSSEIEKHFTIRNKKWAMDIFGWDKIPWLPAPNRPWPGAGSRLPWPGLSQLAAGPQLQASTSLRHRHTCRPGFCLTNCLKVFNNVSWRFLKCESATKHSLKGEGTKASSPSILL